MKSMNPHVKALDKLISNNTSKHPQKTVHALSPKYPVYTDVGKRLKKKHDQLCLLVFLLKELWTKGQLHYLIYAAVHADTRDNV